MASIIKKIIIDPRCRINYSSYYVEGLRSLFGSSKIEFRCLKGIVDGTVPGMAVKVMTADDEKRVFFDCFDGNSINEAMYEWADSYGKVNLQPDDASRDKIISIGPSFGVSLWNPVSTLMRLIKNCLIIKRDSGAGVINTLKWLSRDYVYMLARRKKYSYYHHFAENEQCGYVFSLNTLWWGELSENTTNRFRGDFMCLCKRHMDIFEGGFFYVADAEKESKKYADYLRKYKDMIYKKRLSMSDYDKRNRKSWFVFNTPSVIGCHGWKLGEYLCEGKAIISTPLNNVMPGDFKNGVQYLEVDNINEMEAAILQLRDNAEMVAQLKQNAFNYFNKWVSPEASVRLVLAKAGVLIP